MAVLHVLVHGDAARQQLREAGLLGFVHKCAHAHAHGNEDEIAWLAAELVQTLERL